MKHFRKNEGFTLVELMVSILIGTIITGAAVTVLLLGLRMNKAAADTASRQNTTRTVLTVLEKLASDGKITNVKMENYDWEIFSDDTVLMSYSFDMQNYIGKIYTGNAQSGSVMLENVEHSYVELNKKGLLTFSIETKDGSFKSSVYCRSAVAASDSAASGNDAVDKNESDDVVEDVEKVENSSMARAAFLKVLLSQKDRKILGTTTSNPGLILDGSGNSTGVYYTQWYIDGYNNETKPGWDKDTPWCVTYVSWCMYQCSASLKGDPPRYANVDTFWEDIQDSTKSIGTYCKRGDYTPQPGDLVFFDWIINAEENPQHMGVVLSVAGGYIYTIEGNTAGRVALRKYALSDARILGYGVLNWN